MLLYSLGHDKRYTCRIMASTKNDKRAPELLIMGDKPQGKGPTVSLPLPLPK